MRVGVEYDLNNGYDEQNAEWDEAIMNFEELMIMKKIN